MDQNKKEKLIEIGYRVQKSCALCIHSQFNYGDWGLCGKFFYLHQKHSPVAQNDGKRSLSIHKTGVCSGFELSEEKLSELHGFGGLYVQEDSSS